MTTRAARITYAPRGDATPEAELDALAAVYSLCIRKHQECKEAAHPAAPDDVKESNGYVATDKHSR